MARVSVSLLGGFQVRLDSGPAIGLPTRKAQALLAYLAVPPGQEHPRDKLAALLWGGIREDSARASLRQALFAIRKALGDAAASVLPQEGDSLRLDPASVEADVMSFERAVKEASPASLARAAELYRGDLLAGVVIDEAPFEEWLLGERERLRELALEALAKLLAHQHREGAVEAALQTALKLLTLDPLQEPVHRVLMRLYADLGRRGAALRQYQQCVGALQRELGTEPDTETKQLYETILRERPRRAPSTAPPAVRTVPPSVRRSSPFVGRAAETATLLGALDRAVAGHGSAVAVLAEAGAGKSRIASELATEATARQVSVLTGRTYESEQILAFGPWVDALRAARITADPRLLERLEPTWRAELSRLVPELGAPPPAPVETRRLFDAVVAVLGHLTAREPLAGR
jgi:DNA-binding SARP family transcriptional activator